TIAIFLLLPSSAYSSCDSTAYKVGTECCPVCAPGTRVYRHCTAQTSTACVSCMGSTFTEKPNGLIKCKIC
ncbi:hypothetical protein GN956_G27067, partial [Arapaima gigas]